MADVFLNAGCVGQRMNFFSLSFFLFILSCPTFISAERSVLLDSSKQDQDESRLLFFEHIILRRLNEPSNESKNVTNCTKGNNTKDEGHGRRLNEPVGPKFDEKELEFLDQENQDYIRKLTVIWGVKESIFKIRNEVGISFNDHIHLQPFELKDQLGTASLHFQNKVIQFEFHFIEIDNFILVYAFLQNQ